ncbi:MAG: metallopeptidase TldD-related protein [Candidatus Dormiibacterota bacterium]
MSDDEELLTLGDSALARLERGEAEIVIVDDSSELTRFASNEIHQSVAERSRSVRVRLIDDGRIGVGEVRGFGAAAVQRALAAAEESRRVTTNPEVSPLPHPDGLGGGPVAFSAATAAATPEQRAELVSIVTGAANAHAINAYGALSTATRSTAIVTSAGIRRAATTTQASLVTVARGDDGGGYASRHSADIDALDVDGLAGEVVDTCMRNQHATAIDPGDYEVVLSPYAVTDLLEHLAWVGFSALATQEHRSFMRMDEQLMSTLVTIRDDAAARNVFPFPFDAEGVSTQRLNLIDRGVCAGVVYDTPTALRDGVESTGHSLPQPNTWGPLPRHLVMDAGDTPREEMVRSVSRGLYVTRFWYVRDVHPLRTVITGMTREGTFLIEDGRITRPVRDLRFTQSIVAALAGVVQVSREQRLELGEGESGVLSPWLHINRFTFSS